MNYNLNKFQEDRPRNERKRRAQPRVGLAGGDGSSQDDDYIPKPRGPHKHGKIHPSSLEEVLHIHPLLKEILSIAG